MRVVVTGGAGFIGSHVADALVDRGDQVIVIDDLSTGDRRYVNDAVEFHQLDIRSEEASALVRATAPDAVCHQAAQMSVSRSVRDPLFDASVNVVGSLSLLRAATDARARFVFASTGGALYGDAEVLPTPESCPAWPVSPYGVGKLSFEHYLHCFHVVDALGYTALRYANVYGPRQSPHGEAGVVAIFCQAVLEGRPPVINGDGTHTRDYVFVSDVVRANLLALDNPAIGHFNVGTGRQCDVNKLFALLVERLGSDVQAVHGPARPGEQRTSALDYSLIENELGWRPTVTLEDGLAKTAAWFKQQR